jgi:hypothetical protein
MFFASVRAPITPPTVQPRGEKMTNSGKIIFSCVAKREKNIILNNNKKFFI